LELALLVKFVERKVESLGELATTVSAMSNANSDRERLASFATIELSNLNSEWMRRYYIAVSMNEAVRVNGRKIVIGRKQPTVDDAVLHAIGILNGTEARQRWINSRSRILEPNWSSTNTLPQLSKVMVFPHSIAITTAVAAGRDATNTLRAARNYYAHRNIDSRADLRQTFQDALGWTGFRSPSIEIFNQRYGSFPSVFAYWLAEGERISKEICEI
jgi:hypothetical protein